MAWSYIIVQCWFILINSTLTLERVLYNSHNKAFSVIHGKSTGLCFWIYFRENKVEELFCLLIRFGKGDNLIFTNQGYLNTFFSMKCIDRLQQSKSILLNKIHLYVRLFGLISRTVVWTLIIHFLIDHYGSD